MGTFNLSLNPKMNPSDNEEVKMSLSIENKAAKDCFISRDVIMLDGFKNDKFQIVHHNGEKATYTGRYVKYYPELILLKENGFLSNELNLSEAYEFSKDGDYSITYSTQLKCCLDKEGKDCLSSELIEANTHISLLDHSSS